MHKLILAAAAFLPLAAGSSAAAQTRIDVPAFSSIELRGGGELVVRHGSERRVTLISGNRELAGFDVERDGTLVIRACRTSCRNQRLRVEIVAPEIDALAITGGGTIRTEGGFAREDNLAVAIHGGGTIDARAIPARNVAAAIHGGGRIRTAAERSLAASINGGGAILYTGQPVRSVSINGGGSVTADR